jgi:hypothetical protein
MPQEVITGLSDARGELGPPVFVPGDYLVEITKYEKDDEKDNMAGYKFWTTIHEGPDQEDDRDPNGETFFFSVWIPEEGHPSYSDSWYKRSVNQLKVLLNAAGVKITGTDKVNIEEVVGEQVVFTLAVFKSKKDGTRQNAVNNIKAVD